MSHPIEQALSAHANKRMQQRAIRPEEAHIVFTYGDRSKTVGGAVAISLSLRLANDLVADGTISAGIAHRLSRLVLVVATDTNTIITMAWLHGQRSRAYTRGATIH